MGCLGSRLLTSCGAQGYTEVMLLGWDSIVETQVGGPAGLSGSQRAYHLLVVESVWMLQYVGWLLHEHMSDQSVPGDAADRGLARFRAGQRAGQGTPSSCQTRVRPISLL